METRSSKRRKLLLLHNQPQQQEHSDLSLSSSSSNAAAAAGDRISDLPDAVLHQILLLLPIHTAASTSALSRRWLSLWSSLPDLDFSTVPPGTVPVGPLRGHHSPPPAFLPRLLRRRSASLRSLRFRSRLSFSALYALIRAAVRRSVQDLDIDAATDDLFNLPRCLARCDSLRSLRLRSICPGFRLPPPPSVAGGFRSLQALTLSLVNSRDRPSLAGFFAESTFPALRKLRLQSFLGLEHLEIGCRALEEIDLEGCLELRSLKIFGGKLEKVRVEHCFEDPSGGSWVEIEGPKLRVLVWEGNTVMGRSRLAGLGGLREAKVGFLEDEVMGRSRVLSVTNFICGLSHAHSLTLDCECVKILAGAVRFGVVLPVFEKVKDLNLRVKFTKMNVSGLAFLFQSFPMVQNLTMRLTNVHNFQRRGLNSDLWESGSEEECWESHSHTLKSFLQNLILVELNGDLQCEDENNLVKFLLKHAEALQELVLCIEDYGTRNYREKIKAQLMEFSWASSNANIYVF